MVKEFNNYMLIILQRYPRVVDYLKNQVRFDKVVAMLFSRTQL